MARVKSLFAWGFAFVALGSVPAHSVEQTCVSRKLSADDTRALRAAVAEVSGERSVKWSSLSTCVGSDDHASTWVDLKSEPQRDSTSIESGVDCAKSSGSWRCGLVQTRRAGVSVVLGGREKAFDIDAPVSFDREQMKLLLKRAHEVAPSMKTDQGCNSDQAVDADSLRDNQKAFMFRYPRTVGTIEEKDGQISLTVDEETMRFARDVADPTTLVFRCWGRMERLTEQI